MLCNRREALQSITAFVTASLALAQSKEVRAAAAEQGLKLLPPKTGIYHAAFPDFTEYEDVVSASAIRCFEEHIAKKRIVWAYFSNNWYAQGKEGQPEIAFPWRSFDECDRAGVLPFVRLMPRVNLEGDCLAPNPFSLEAIAGGAWDAAICDWARHARDRKSPILAEFGTEVNGDWFPWSGACNGKEAGPSRFIAAYRRIVKLFRKVGAENVTWFYHVNYASAPETDWNTVETYFPGEDCVDWLGASIYGAQNETAPWVAFEDVLRPVYDALAALPGEKPVAVLEFGVHDDERKPAWIESAIKTIADSRCFPRLKAMSYWHSDCLTCNPQSLLRIDSRPDSAKAYQNAVNDSFFVASPLLG